MDFSFTDEITGIIGANRLFFSARLEFPHTSVGKESAYNAGDPGSIPGLGRLPREGNGYPLQYSCLENPMDRGAWWATVHGVARFGHDLVTKPPPSHFGLGGVRRLRPSDFR